MKWLVILFATATLASQSAMDFFASLLFLWMLWEGYRWRTQSSGRTLLNKVGFDWIFPVWIVVVALGISLNAHWDDTTLMRWLEFRWILYMYVFTAAIIYLRPSEAVQKPAAIILAVCSAYAIAVYFIGYDLIKGPDFVLSETAGGVRTGGLYANAMTFAHAYGLVFCLFFGCLLTAVQWKEKVAPWLLLAVTLTAVGILLSFTRGVWMSLTVASFFMTFLMSKRLAVLFTLGAGVLIVALMLSWPGLRDRAGDSFKAGGDQERIDIWKANIQMWKDHPILGVGYGENTRLAPEYYKRVNANPGTIVSHAHNQFLNFLSGTGILGLLCYLIFSFGFLRMGLRTLAAIPSSRAFHRGLCVGVIGAQISLHVGSLTESNFEHAKIKYILTIVWALTTWLAYEYRVLRAARI